MMSRERERGNCTTNDACRGGVRVALIEMAEACALSAIDSYQKNAMLA